jgi:DNA-binding NarL/FixJ family response regulator
MFREGVAATLHAAVGMAVAGLAADASEAVALARRLQPDVVLLDVQMPGVEGTETMLDIRRAAPRARIVALSMHDDPAHVLGAVEAGARGYLVKGAGAEEIVAAILAVAAGGAAFGPGAADHVLERCRSARNGGPPPAPFPALTEREREVLDLMARGLATHEVAARLALSAKTVRNLVSSILTKLGVVDRAQAVLLARDAGLGR